MARDSGNKLFWYASPDRWYRSHQRSLAAQCKLSDFVPPTYRLHLRIEDLMLCCITKLVDRIFKFGGCKEA